MGPFMILFRVLDPRLFYMKLLQQIWRRVVQHQVWSERS